MRKSFDNVHRHYKGKKGESCTEGIASSTLEGFRRPQETTGKDGIHTLAFEHKFARVYACVLSVLSQHEYLEKINKTFNDFDRLHKANVGMRQQFEKRYMRCKEKQKNLQERMLKVLGRAHKHLVQVEPE